MRKHLGSRPFRRAAWIAVSVLLTVGVTWLWAHEGHQALPTEGLRVDAARGLVFLSPDSRESLGVETVALVKATGSRIVTAPATLEVPWGRHAFASSPASGRIIALHVQPGQEVRAGQKLAEVRSLEVDNFLLEYANARSEEKVAGDNLDQLQAGRKNGVVTQQQIDEARARNQEAHNSLEIARRKLEVLGLPEPKKTDGSPTPASYSLAITSLISGVVLHVDGRVGQVVEPEQHLFEIVNRSQILTKIDVLDEDLAAFEIGQQVEVRLTSQRHGDKPWPGRVVSKSPILDRTTRLGTVWAELPESLAERPSLPLLPGTMGQATLARSTGKTVLRLPPAALIVEGAERYVFLEEGPGQYLRKPVLVNQETSTDVFIEKGDLTAGDRVVTAGSQELATLFETTVLRVTKEASARIGIRTAQVMPHAIAEIVEVNGVFELPPERRATAAAQLSGTVRKILVDRDQKVHAGDLLAEVSSAEFQTLQLELLRSHLQFLLLDENLNRLLMLQKAGSPALSQRELREVQNNQAAMRHKRDSLRDKLRAVGVSDPQIQDILDNKRFLAGLPIRAPIDGVVVRFDGALGQAVKADTRLFDIYDFTGLTIHGFLPEAEVARIHVGQQVHVYGQGIDSSAIEAVVHTLAPVLDTEDRTLSFWAELKGTSSRLALEGALARIGLLQSESVVERTVPRESLLHQGSREYVFVQGKNGVYERRLVLTGRADDRFVEILSGLVAGEIVAAHGVSELQTAYNVLK